MATDGSSMVVENSAFTSSDDERTNNDLALKPTKRSRSEPFSSATEEGNRNRDVYEDIIWGNNNDSRSQYPQVGQTINNNQVRSSWLTNIFTLRCSEILSFQVSETDQLALKNEIEQLNRQLNQVKRRLRPAAERCTEAINSFDSNNYATTGRQEFDEARRACNPMEVLGEGQNGGLNKIFMNRSAIKLANIDAMLDFSLTQFPPGSQRSIFLFADLCAAPGGFTEYILRKCYKSGMPACRGYGMSLIGVNEHGHGFPWKMQDPGVPHYHYRVCQGADGTGDIFRWDNVEALRKDIMFDLYSVGYISSGHEGEEAAGVHQGEQGKVHLVLADGGFDAQRDSDCQEEITLKLVVCQVAAALTLLRKGGTLAVKTFGFQTQVIRTMMRSLFLLFDRLTILKPISSRPASAERYIVLTGFKGTTPEFDGQRWRDKIFFCDPNMHGGSLEMCDLIVRGRIFDVLDQFLNEVDRDLLSLNLKACFSILSYLESKCMRISKGESDSYQWIKDRVVVDIEQYRTAWHLF